MRQSKPGDERKKELLDAALELFYVKGYEKTSVNDVLKKVGIAKGTFYYYFSSKEELLDAVAARQVTALVDRIRPIIEDRDRGALQKLNLLIKKGQQYKQETKERRQKLFAVMSTMDNIRLIHRLSEKIIELSVPLIRQVFVEGNREGVFRVEFPGQAALFYVRMGNQLNYSISAYLARDDRDENEKEELKNMVLFYQDTLEKILGLEKGSLEVAADISRYLL